MADENYGGYAVRSARGKDVSTAQTTTSNDTYAGYPVRSAGQKSTSTYAASTSLATTEGGYQRRRAPQDVSAAPTNLAQYDNANKNDGAYKVKSIPQSDENYGGYAVRSARGKDVSTAQASTNTSNESYGGYAVRSAGQKSASTNLAATEDGYQRRRAPQDATAASSSRVEYAQSTSGETYGGYAVRSSGGNNQAQQSRNVAQNVSRPRGGVPASNGAKVYGSRGERMGLTASQMDRSVIVMPKRGRSITGVVIQDDPGRSIVVQTSTGTQSTYRYGEIDALVNL